MSFTVPTLIGTLVSAAAGPAASTAELKRAAVATEAESVRIRTVM
ncbi:hypothetical protein [Streptomyces griseoluteus]